ncbi:MAG: transporter [Chloroflexota bacterium]|jgi:drug/metabolite transporter (DMT)-like permease|nr:transporter [Chloroflexota bacterium]MDP6757247.1 transporter [Chloroflexota bacterium]
MGTFGPALLLALLAAAGNALFIYAQKRADLPQNPLLLLAGAAFVAFVLLVIYSTVVGLPDVAEYGRTRGVWMFLTGVGLMITFVGFNFLFNRFGASYYSLYAALSILTTSVGIGFLVFREPLNSWIVAATGATLLAIALLGIGVARTQL